MKKTTKKLVSLGLAAAMAASLTACGGKSDNCLLYTSSVAVAFLEQILNLLRRGKRGADRYVVV